MKPSKLTSMLGIPATAQLIGNAANSLTGVTASVGTISFSDQSPTAGPTNSPSPFSFYAAAGTVATSVNTLLLIIIVLSVGVGVPVLACCCYQSALLYRLVARKKPGKAAVEVELSEPDAADGMDEYETVTDDEVTAMATTDVRNAQTTVAAVAVAVPAADAPRSGLSFGWGLLPSPPVITLPSMPHMPTLPTITSGPEVPPAALSTMTIPTITLPSLPSLPTLPSLPSAPTVRMPAAHWFWRSNETATGTSAASVSALRPSLAVPGTVAAPAPGRSLAAAAATAFSQYSFFPVAAHSPTRAPRTNTSTSTSRAVAFAADVDADAESNSMASNTHASTGFGVFGMFPRAGGDGDGDGGGRDDDLHVEVDDDGDRESIEPWDDGDDDDDGESTPPAGGIFGWLTPAKPQPTAEAVPTWFSTATRQDRL